MTLTEFSDALKAAVPASYQSAAPAGVRPCVVWSAYGSRTLDGDDRTQTAISKVQLDILAAKVPGSHHRRGDGSAVRAGAALFRSGQ